MFRFRFGASFQIIIGLFNSKHIIMKSILLFIALAFCCSMIPKVGFGQQTDNRENLRRSYQEQISEIEKLKTGSQENLASTNYHEPESRAY